MNPTIQDAKDLALKYRKMGVIILFFDGDNYGYSSYGMTREKCSEMKKLGDRIFNLVGGKEVRDESP